MKKYLTSDGRGGADGKCQTTNIDYKLLKGTQNAYLMNEASGEETQKRSKLACLGEIIWSKGLSMAVDALPDPSSDTYIYTLKKGFSKGRDAHAKSLLGENFKLLSRNLARAKGPIKATKFYTAVFDDPDIGQTVENPVYIQAEGEIDAPVDALQKRAWKIMEKMDNRIENSRQLNSRVAELYDSDWTYYKEDNEYFNGDLRGLRDVGPYWPRLSKIGLMRIHRAGQENVVNTFTAPDGRTVTIKCYTKPGVAKTWLDMFVGDKKYNVRDNIVYNILMGDIKDILIAQRFVGEEIDHAVESEKHSRFPGGKPPLEHYT